MKTLGWMCVSLVLGAAVCHPVSGQPVAPAGGGVDASRVAAPLVPRSVFFGNPVRSQARVSPDGTRIAFLAPVDGVMNIHVAPITDIEKAVPVTSDRGRGIPGYSWAYNGTHILYIQDKGGDENWKVYSQDVKAGGPARDLTPFEEILGPDGQPIMLPSGDKLRPAARIENVSHRVTNEVLIGLNKRNPGLHDLYRVNITTGEMKLVAENQGFLAFVTDDNFSVRFAIRPNTDGSMAMLRAQKSADAALSWEPFQEIPAEDVDNFDPLMFDVSGKVLYARDSRGRDTAAIVAIDAATGAKQLVAGRENCDAGTILAHPTDNTLQAVEFTYDMPWWTLLSNDLKKDFEFLKKIDHESQMLVTSRSLDDRYWTVAFIPDRASPSVYLYDRVGAEGKPTRTLLFKTQPELEKYRLSRMHAVVVPARDGLKLVSYLTLPPGSDPDNDGVPNRPVPLVLNVHGGPTARDNWGYDPEHQWLANRGYAVLSVNYRGSTGFGKRFLNAGNMEWAGKMHDDLIDAVNWAIDKKIADKSKVAIYGGSYGGYATLVGLTFTPDVFACGVDIVGPSNLETLLNSIPPHWGPYIDVLTRKTGDHRTEEGRAFLKSRSPIHFVDRITKPLLIAQGANDPRVKQAESDQIVEAMKDRNIPVTYVLYPEEGHGFRKPENRLSFYAIAEQFLAANLGGRAEPIGDALKGANLTVPAGAELISGLSEAAGNH
ncbi:MAG: S9 family peptidase [Phycisphaeraceae bacterium]|nr:S9 family peptidase [Phycisphaeraceae bacterium]